MLSTTARANAGSRGLAGRRGGPPWGLPGEGFGGVAVSGFLGSRGIERDKVVDQCLLELLAELLELRAQIADLRTKLARQLFERTQTFFAGAALGGEIRLIVGDVARQAVRQARLFLSGPARQSRHHRRRPGDESVER